MKILEGKTVKLRDSENNVILPRTLARNVHMADGETIDEVIQALVERIAELEEAVEALKGGNLPEQPDTPVDPEPDQPEEPEVEVKVEEVVVEGVEEFEFSPEVFEYELQPQEGVEVVSLYVQLPEEVEVKQITVNDEAVEPVLPLEVQLGEEDTVVKVTVDQMEEEPAPASETEKVYTFVFKAIVVPEQPEEPDTPVDPEPVVSHVEDLRIVQYYGAGGKKDGMLTCDFIELYNNGEHDVLLQYATLNYTKMGKTAESQNQWQLIQLPEVVLPAHHSFLVQGQVNRYPVKDSEIPMVVADCDFACGVEFDNGAIKLVLSQATEAYPAGHVDPFEIDDTIIDHIYACAEDKGSRMDVAPMAEDISKNNGALQVAEGVWDIADYKTSHDEPQHANLLPKNMAAGEHYPFAVIGPVAEETHVTVYTDDLNAVETVSYKVLDVPADAVVEDMEINGDTNENITFDFETSSIVARTSSILANILYVEQGDTEGKVELKAVFAGYLRVKVYLKVIHGANPDAPVIPEPVVSHVEDLVIAQYYGAGGKTDGMLTCDFIELYNNGEHDVLMQYASLNYTKMGKDATSQNQWQLIQLPEVVLPPHHSFLIQGNVNRYPIKDSEIPMVVADCDMQTGMEFDNGAIKLVLSQAKEAYPAGHVDPFEIDETIIDHVYACADDKGDRMDVEPMVMDLSKNNGALHSADGIWVVADYKDENDMPQNAELLPCNMAAGAHDMFLYVEPEEPETPVEPDPEPEQPALAPIMYGYFPLEVGTEFNITSYDKITLEAVRKGVIREAQERVEGKINIAGEGLLPEGAYIVFAIRADLEITPVRDNGFGGHVPFYEEVCGANGVVVDFDGVQYKLFGELALVEGEWFAYMD